MVDIKENDKFDLRVEGLMKIKAWWCKKNVTIMAMIAVTKCEIRMSV